MPSSSSARFWDWIAPRYARTKVPNEAVYQRKLAITREHLTPQSVVLEIGCGTGMTAIAHAPHVERIDAIDVSGGMLAIARDKARDAGVDTVRFVQAGIEEFEAADGTYDAVLGLGILHLLADPEAAIGKVHGLMRPGGVFVSSTVCLAGSTGWPRFVVPVLSWPRLIPQVKFLRAGDLHGMLERAGFVVDLSWEPPGSRTAFIVARKAD